jgi:hypothetical protein
MRLKPLQKCCRKPRSLIELRIDGKSKPAAAESKPLADKVLPRSCFVALDLAPLPEIFSKVVEQATDGPRKGLNPPPARH